MTRVSMVLLKIDVNYEIKRFKEKPSPGEIFSNLASTGMYVCSPEIFDAIPRIQNMILPATFSLV